MKKHTTVAYLLISFCLFTFHAIEPSYGMIAIRSSFGSSIEGTVFRKALKIQPIQLVVKPGMLPLHQLPTVTGADVAGRILLIRLEEMQMSGVKENRVSIEYYRTCG